MMKEITNHSSKHSTNQTTSINTGIWGKAGNTVIVNKVSRNNKSVNNDTLNMKKNANNHKHQQYSPDKQISNAWNEVHEEEDGKDDLRNYLIKIWQHEEYCQDIISDRSYYCQSPLGSDTDFPDPEEDPMDF